MVQFEKVYLFLCLAFSSLFIIGNIIYQKFVSFSFLGLTVFEISVGALLYPLTFLITDLITEFYGKVRAQICIRFALIMNLFVGIILYVMDQLPTASWSKMDGATFHAIFGFYYIAFGSSMIACYISQYIDVHLYTWIRTFTHSRHLWLRNNVSTLISLFIDTSIVISILCACNILPWEKSISLICNSYAFKAVFTIFCTPFFYLFYEIIKRRIKEK